MLQEAIALRSARAWLKVVRFGRKPCPVKQLRIEFVFFTGYTNRESPFRCIELRPLKTIDRPKVAVSPCLKYFIVEMWFGNKVHVRASENDVAIIGTCQRFGIQGCEYH